MATLPMQVVSIGGLSPNYGAAAAGDKVKPGDRTWIVVKNGGGSPVTVTLDATGLAPGGLPPTDPTVSVPASGERWIGPIIPDAYRGTDGLCAISYSATASVTVAAVRI